MTPMRRPSPFSELVTPRPETYRRVADERSADAGGA